MKQKIMVEIEVEAPYKITSEQAWVFFDHIVGTGSLNADTSYNNYRISAKAVEPENKH